MYRDDELDVNEEYEDVRKSKCFKPHMTSPYYSMPCPMPMPMMQQPMMQDSAMQDPMMQQPMMQDPMMQGSMMQGSCHHKNMCPVCGKPMKYRDDEDFDLETGDEDTRYPKYNNYNNSKHYYPHYYPHYYKPYYNPYYKPYSKPYHKPYHPYGPWWMKRDSEE